MPDDADAILARAKYRDGELIIRTFNTPKWFINLSFGNREVFKNFGFNIVWRWQDAFIWESPLPNGVVPGYQTIDAQITYSFPKLNSRIKIGGSNIFNRRYIQYAAGPNIGALYYAAITVDGVLKGEK